MDEEGSDNGQGRSSSREELAKYSDCSDRPRDLESLGTGVSARSSGNSKVKNLEQLASAAFKRRGRRKERKRRVPRKPSMRSNAARATTSRSPEDLGEVLNMDELAAGARASTASRRRRGGRVIKRKTRSGRVQRRRPKRRPRVRYSSIDSMFSSPSCRSSSDAPCGSCGHRCCHLSYRECMEVESSGTLEKSPLLVKAYAPVADPRAAAHCEVTPEMIHAALRNLTMWREEVSTEMILDYIMRNYPVCPDKAALLQDLQEKLRIALITGLVSTSRMQTWSLAPALCRRLSTTHVTLFWEVYYGLSMAPVRRKVPNKQNASQQDKKTNKEKKSEA